MIVSISDRCRRVIALARILVSAPVASVTGAVASAPAPEAAVELSAKSAKFVEVKPVGPRVDQPWSRAIPGRVAIPTTARTNVGMLIDGRVEQILVKPGDKVEAGTPLVRIQSTGGGSSRADAELASARLAAAEESLKRVTNMVQRGVATDVERLEAEVHLREAQIESQRTSRAVALLGEGKGSQMAISAPTSGVVLNVTVAVGAVVQTGGEVVEIGDPKRAWIEADLSEDDAGGAKVGERVQIEMLRRGGTLSGKIEAIAAQIDPATRRRRIFIAPEHNAAGSLALGLPVEVRLPESQEQLALPVEAVLIKGGDRRIVYVQLANGKFTAREVVVSDASGGWVRVLKGLAPNEQVVVKGALLLDGRAEQLL